MLKEEARSGRHRHGSGRRLACGRLQRHVSIGGPSTVPRHSVETQVATTLARQVNQPVPKVVCPGDLKAKVGTVMYCSLTAQGSTTAYPMKVEVDSTSGGKVHFNIQVSQTPGHFTAPG